MTALPKLQPLTSPWMFKLIEDYALQEEIFNAHHSPVNVHHLPTFKKNVGDYKEILDGYGIKNQLFFARKANKFKNLIPAAVEAGIGIDTASFHELKQCLDLGIAADLLISTAAIKNNELLNLAIKNGVTIIIDNRDELEQTLNIAQQQNTTVKIGIRISGFMFNGEKLQSRFGFDIDDVETVIHDFFASAKTTQTIQLTGFHFHLDGYSTAQRGEALHQTLDLIERLRPQGFDFSFVDIGGGILMNYLAEATEWKNFQEILKQAVLGDHVPITYNNDGLGFKNRNGEIEGKLNTYPYYNENTKPHFLKAVLETENAAGKHVASRLKELDIQLRLEPGRSLLDQVGITMARVAHRKVDAQGNNLVGLEMNMSQMKSSSADFLLDPFACFKNPDPDAEAVDVYFTGAYCLERDVLLKRKITLPQLPAIGDTIIFVNTAGYMMHFFETEAHLFKRAANVALSTEKSSFTKEDFQSEDYVTPIPMYE